MDAAAMAGNEQMENPPPPSKKDIKARAMKRRICAAAVSCIDELGYAATSINRIQQRAGVSRGALTHHFPTKQALVAETAMRLLHAAAQPLRSMKAERQTAGHSAQADSVSDLLMKSWTDIANTPQGRAFVEILVACRTDRDLYDVLAEGLHNWDAQNSAAIREHYQGSETDDDDAALLWSINRTFIRGLLIHERFVSDPDYLQRMMQRFAGIMQAHLLSRV
tara:strand:+ start:16859 stop:17524 length:666 start_codon:yes stop_codon:yes gene_type:complete